MQQGEKATWAGHHGIVPSALRSTIHEDAELKKNQSKYKKNGTKNECCDKTTHTRIDRQ